jgi:hypothetical protein
MITRAGLIKLGFVSIGNTYRLGQYKYTFLKGKKGATYHGGVFMRGGQTVEPVVTTIEDIKQYVS